MTIIATIATRPSAPLLLHRDRLRGAELVVCGLRPTDGVVTLADLGLPHAVLRMTLDGPDIARLAKPWLLRHLVESHTDRTIVVVDELTLAWSAVPVPRPLLPGAIRLTPRVPRNLAARKPSPEAAAEAGAGDPTGAVVQLRAGGDVLEVLDRWAGWMTRAYTRSAATPLRDAETAFLRTLPPAVPEVEWDHDGVWASWDDLHEAEPMPCLVGVEGLDGYRAADNAALDLISRRTHSSRVLDEVLRALPDTPPDPPQWASGDPLPAHVRAVIRACDPWGARWEDPGDDVHHGLRAWLDAEDDRGLTRLERAVYWSRPDLQASYPPTTPVRVLSTWMREVGLTSSGEPTAAPAPPRPITRVWRGARRRTRSALGHPEATIGSARAEGGAGTGVNVVGFARSESGLGEAMRATLAAVDGLYVPSAVLDLSDRVFSRQQAAGREGGVAGTPYDVSVLHVNPEELLGYLPDSLSHRMAAHWTVGMWFWESDRVPRSWLPAFDVVDEVWAATRYLADVFGAETSKPVHVVGLPVEVPEGVQGERGRWGIASDELVVMYVTDAFSGQDRKNPLAAVEAFRHAFAPGFDGVRLVLKISNLEKFPALARALRDASAGLPITVVGEYLDRSQIWDLLACADVYLSLHASEGFGLTILEGMALGVPAVATRYGGSLDFTDDENALLVGYDLVPSRGGPGDVYSRGGRWARPHIEEAAAHLRRLAEDADLRRRLGSAAMARAQEFSMTAYRARIAARLRAAGLSC